jgi:transcription antitermination factor NusG
MKDEGTDGIHDYMTHVADAASFESYQRSPDSGLLSAEALPENSSIIDFKAFSAEYPEKLFPLVAQLRPEFQEFFIEFHILRKSQAFIGKCHGQIQTRVWQVLRLVEQAIGSMIILGTNPTAEIIRPILRKARVESTEYGSLTDMIISYAKTQNYAQVAKEVRAPVPAIRKIFRPVIADLLAHKDVKAVAVGAFLRSLTHQASLTGAGLSKRCKARNRRVKTLRFTAPPSEISPLLSFGHTEVLADTPWCLLEISSEGRMAQITPTLREQGKKVFGKKAGQIFAPLNSEGELEFGYLFARSITPAMTRKLTKIRGIGEMSTVCDEDGNFVHAVTVPNAEVQALINKHDTPNSLGGGAQPQDFVEILTGEAKGYHGTVLRMNTITEELTVEVSFPTGRNFLVTTDISSVRKLPKTAVSKRMFWGPLPN